MKFEHTEVMNFEGAFRGLRNPMNSWARSDSEGGLVEFYGDEMLDVTDSWMAKAYPDLDESENFDEWYEKSEEFNQWLADNGKLKEDDDFVDYFFIGPNDMDLAQRMIKAGSPNDKFLRQIFVSVDITAPMYWWSEFDTYKVGTVANSTSKMHKLAAAPITRDCFEMDDYQDVIIFDNEPYNIDDDTDSLWLGIIDACETLRQRYNETKDIRYWKELIRILPESWLQTRTVTMNYANLKGMYCWRQNHKLTEWHQFCNWVETLPYSKELIIYNNKFDKT